MRMTRPQSPHHRLLVLLASVLFIFGFTKTEAAEWKDPSHHTVRFVEVEPGVKLEVLDWGGSGNPILLLAGHGNTGHIFDAFAPLLTPSFHVLAITRRGFGASSQPQKGYELTRLVEDISQVIDVLKLKRVHLVGHSIAGDEMTRFARIYPAKVGKLVYLEAAYDRLEAMRVAASFPHVPPLPEPSVGTPASMRAILAQTTILMPEAEIRATRIFSPDGSSVKPVTPDWIDDAVARMVEHPDYSSVRAPMLAIYSVYQNPAQLFPRYTTDEPEVRHSLDEIFATWQSFTRTQRESFRKSAANARVVEIAGARHFLFISHQENVLREVQDFLRTP